MDTKKCTRCKQDKPVSDFSRDKNTKDGLDRRCNECLKALRAEYQTRYALAREGVNIVTKECSRCKREKPASDFTNDKSRKDGLCIYCSECRSVYRVERTMKQRSEIVCVETCTEKLCRDCKQVKPISEFGLTLWGKAQPRCKACESERLKIYYQKTTVQERKRYWHVKKHYGLTAAEYQRLIMDKGGRCSLCDKPMERINVDHDHETGAVRGLLCKTCNTGLGHFGDDPEMLLRAYNYLKGGNIA